MHFKIKKESLSNNLRDALRRCGYFGLQDRNTGKISYVRRLSKSQYYPRFHLYIDDMGVEYKFNLHLDQKKESYKGVKAHSADYDEPAVNEEGVRITSIIS